MNEFNQNLNNQPLLIYYSNGPYSLIDDLDYKPLDNYIDQILNSKPQPDVAIFVYYILYFYYIYIFE